MIEILLISIIVFCSFFLIWELIPDFVKKYWGYMLSVRKDRKKGRRRKYNFTWRRENQ